MPNNFKNLYEEVFTKVYPKIENQKIGILYETIQIILHEDLEDGQDSDERNAVEICQYFGIDPHDDDNIFVSDVRKLFSYSLSGNKAELNAARILDNVIPNVKNAIINKEDERKKMKDAIKWIVFAGCVIVGTIACRAFLERSKKEQEKNNNRPQDPQIKREPERVEYPPSPITAFLCLITPANIVSELTNSSSISADHLSDLIDSSSYFLCANRSDTDSAEQRLIMTGDTIPPDSNREVYVRVKIDNGGALIGKKSAYGLKTNLPEASSFIVEKIACLGSLDGLQVFNRK